MWRGLLSFIAHLGGGVGLGVQDVSDVQIVLDRHCQNLRGELPHLDGDYRYFEGERRVFCPLEPLEPEAELSSDRFSSFGSKMASQTAS